MRANDLNRAGDAIWTCLWVGVFAEGAQHKGAHESLPMDKGNGGDKDPGRALAPSVKE